MNLIKDVSLLTKIPENVLQKIEQKCIDSICYDIYQNMLQKEPTTCVDMGIGKLFIKLEDERIFYKIVPSENFENKVSKVVQERYNPLIDNVEQSLTNKIMNVYKELY